MMITVIAFFLMGIWFGLHAVDIYMTRWAIKRQIANEGNPFMKWWMENDIRAISLFVLSLLILGVVTYYLYMFVIPGWVIGIYFKTKVCLHNYKINTRR